MAFCGRCGSQLNENSKFCPNCGTPVPTQDKMKSVQSGTFIPVENKTNNPLAGGAPGSVPEKTNIQNSPSSSVTQKKPDNMSQETRKEVFSGVVHKCPHCGTVLDGFVVTCPGCGYELRAENSLSSVKDLSQKLEMLEQQRQTPGAKESLKDSFKSAFLGVPQVDAVYAAKATAIMSYPIPNTKEEILEFVVLASSNISPEIIAGATRGDANQVQQYQKMLVEQNAWVSKMEQAYKKAQLSFPTDPVFLQVKQIYESKTNEINKAKKRNSLKMVLLVGGILLFCVLMIVGGIALLHSSSEAEKKEKEKEIERLESIVDEIEEDIADGNYSAAKRKAQRLHYDGPDDNVKVDEKGNLEKSWDETREGYIEEIEKLEKEAKS